MKISLNFPDTLLEKMNQYCAVYGIEKSEFVRGLVIAKLEGALLPQKSDVPPKKDTIPTVPIPESPRIPGNPAPVYDELWEDHNFMPVKKERLVPQYCSTFHSAGEKRPVYLITRLTGDNKLVYKKLLCKECVVAELTDIKARGEGRLE